MTTLIPKFDLMNGGVTPTGAVNRPINEKLSEIVSVKDFGAVGDGVTDDTAAIQDVLDYGGDNNVAIYVPSGIYLLTSQVQTSLGGKGYQSQLQVYGDGEFDSQFILAKSNTDGGIKVTCTDNSCNVGFSKLGFCSQLDERVVGERDAPNGVALWITNNYGPGQAGYGSHQTNSVILDQLYVGAYGSAIVDNAVFGSWTKGIQVDYMWYITIQNCWVKGLSQLFSIYDPQTRPTGINIAGIELNSCFAPNINNVQVNGYYDYGLHHHGVALTGNAEQGGYVANSFFVNQKYGITADHSNTTNPGLFHVGFQILGCHINSDIYGIHVFYHSEVLIEGCYIYASSLATTPVAQPIAIYLEAAADVIISGCGFYQPGFYVSDSNCTVGVKIGSVGTAGISLQGCQFNTSGIGIINDSNFVSYAFGTVWFGQTGGGLWGTFKQALDNTGSLLMDGGSRANTFGEKQMISQRTDTTNAPRYSLVSQRTDYATNTNPPLGATYYYGLNSANVSKSAAIFLSQWQNNTSGSENSEIVLYTLVNGALTDFATLDSTNKRINVPNGYSYNIGGNTGLFAGAGSPEGAITANRGSLYMNTSGGASTTLYVKESGVGNTGWVAK